MVTRFNRFIHTQCVLNLLERPDYERFERVRISYISFRFE
nr:hypothetical protein PECWAHUG_PECWAHUG_CDS_0013 [Microvirus sp.]